MNQILDQVNVQARDLHDTIDRWVETVKDRLEDQERKEILEGLAKINSRLTIIEGRLDAIQGEEEQ